MLRKTSYSTCFVVVFFFVDDLFLLNQWQNYSFSLKLARKMTKKFPK